MSVFYMLFPFWEQRVGLEDSRWVSILRASTNFDTLAKQGIFFHPHAAWLNAGRFRGRSQALLWLHFRVCQSPRFVDERLTSGNGGCGYVPKPQHLMHLRLSPEDRPDPVKSLGRKGRRAVRARRQLTSSMVCMAANALTFQD